MILKPSCRFSLFQSTPPVRGATSSRYSTSSDKMLFQSTPPVRGATSFFSRARMALAISIHAPRAGGDEHVMGGEE